MIRILALKELDALYRQPTAWVVLSLAQLLMAYQFLAHIDRFMHISARLKLLPTAPGVTQIVVIPTIGAAATMVLFMTPLLTMNTFAGERRAGTYRLLLTLPLSSTSLVLGKYLGTLGIFVAFGGLVGVMLMTLLWGSPIDLGTCASAMLGLGLFMAAHAAIGVAASALTARPMIAAVITLTVGFGLWMLDWSRGLDIDAGFLVALSSLNRFERLASGVVDTADVAYFGSLTLAALVIAVWRIHGERRFF